jgi:rubredoxin
LHDVIDEAALIFFRNRCSSSTSRFKSRKGGENMARYVCQVCGYVYDPAQGDPDNGVPAGTPFEKLPDSWECPVCGAAKSDFAKEA